MRKIKILQVNPTTTVAGNIEVTGDFTPMFQGKFYRNDAGLTQPWYTTTPSAGYVPIVATTFDIIGNAKYNGRYTVYTAADVADLTSSTFGSGKTIIRVNEVVAPLVSGDAANLATDGYLTNISTYVVDTGSGDLVIPPGIYFEDRPVDLIGRNVSGWGESYVQNFIDVTRHFPGTAPPPLPFPGQMYYNSTDKQFRFFDGSQWDLVNRVSYGVTYRHSQTAASNAWTVNHNLNLPAPFTGFVQVFVDRGAGFKMILPSDIVFNSANQLTISFTNTEIGMVVVRQ